MNQGLPDHIVYSPAVIEFVTVAAETCLFLENATEQTRKDFCDQSCENYAALVPESFDARNSRTRFR